MRSELQAEFSQYVDGFGNRHDLDDFALMELIAGWLSDIGSKLRAAREEQNIPELRAPCAPVSHRKHLVMRGRKAMWCPGRG